MAEHLRQPAPDPTSTRRGFLEQMGRGAVAAGVASTLLDNRRLLSAAEVAASAPSGVPAGQVHHRRLGKTGLSVSEVGFGGHSWSDQKIPDGKSFRPPTIDEAVQMIRTGLDMGINFFDACTPAEEHTVPGEALKRLKKRDQVVVSARCCHKMKGLKADQDELYKFVDQRLQMWQTDYFDILMLSNSETDTERSGYWDMSYSIEALDRVKKQGKVRFAGFGSHFTPDLFLEAIDQYARYFDLCSMPYNVRHRAAEKVMPAAEKAGLGIVTIKPFARGSLLKMRGLRGVDAGLPRDLIAFVLENELVDVCICGLQTESQVRENFSASWTKLSPEGRQRLKQIENPPAGAVSAHLPCGQEHAWLERDWRYA